MDETTSFRILVLRAPLAESLSSEERRAAVELPVPLENVVSRQLARIAEEINLDLEKVCSELNARVGQLDRLFDIIAHNVSQMQLSEVEVELSITSEGTVAIAPWGLGASGSLGAGGSLKVKFQPKNSSRVHTQ